MGENNKRSLPMPGQCLMFSTADWDEPYWTNKQHSALQLSRIGWEVIYVESMGLRAPRPGSKKDLGRLYSRFKKGLLSIITGAHKREGKVSVLSPLVIPGGHSNKWIKTINQYLLGYAVRKSGFNEVDGSLIWTYHPYIYKYALKNNNSKMIYHCVDDLGEVPGINKRNFEEAEKELINNADCVFVTAPALKEKISKLKSETYYLSNVVDASHFNRDKNMYEEPKDIFKIPRPRLVYHGVLSDFKIDFELLYECAVERVDWSFVIIGDEREGQNSKLVKKLKKLPNLHFLGFKSYKDLPSYLKYMDVGLLPTLRNNYTKSMFPMKLYEYISMELPVVTTKLDFLRGGYQGVEIGDTSREFIDSIQLQLDRGLLTKDQVESLIGENTWEIRTKRMLEIAYNK